MDKKTDIDKEKKDPLTEETIIGSRKISAAEFQKFFKETLGEDYEKHAVAMDVLKGMFPYKGRTLKEIIEECYHPSWYEKMDESVTSFHVQKKTKAKIEDVIPHYLKGDTQKAALDFAAYLLANKMQLKWDAWNTWKAFSKNKVLCWVKLNLFVRPISLVVSPCLTNINEYEHIVISEGWQDFVLDNFRRCNPRCAGRHSGGELCGVDVTLFGKEVSGICRERFYINNKRVDFENPDEIAINRIKKLLELERTARENESVEKSSNM